MAGSSLEWRSTTAHMPFPSIGPFELLIVLIIALLVLGPGKLPEVGTALGRTIRDFRRATSDVDTALRPDAAPTAPAQPAGRGEPIAEQRGSDTPRAPGP